MTTATCVTHIAASPEVAQHFDPKTPRPSALALGTSAMNRYDLAAPVLDAWFERGGNVLDTAWIYGRAAGQPADAVVGRWLRERAAASNVVILAKVGHPPFCDPAALARQLDECCDQLGVGSVAMVQTHRDDPTVPAGEWADALIDIVDSGRAQTYGLSNWTLGRIQEIGHYVRQRRLRAPAGVSNHFSLAGMVHPIYDGCISARDDATPTWLTATGTLLLPWASQGRGFFALPTEAELSRSWQAPSWYSPRNAVRWHRARTLAHRHGVSPVSIALAWVHHQPFPCLPVVGPRTADELDDTLTALGVGLSDNEARWLAADPEVLLR